MRDVVLLVDDDKTLRIFCRQVLESGGFKVLEAGDGEEARGLAGQADIMITDVEMPKLNGPALVNEVAPRYPKLRILYMTGTARDDSLLQWHMSEWGCQLLQKPFTPADLLRRVRLLLATSERLTPHREWPKILTPILDAAMSAGRTGMGNVQIFDGEERCLNIVVQRGCDPAVLRLFAKVPIRHESRERITIEDLTNSKALPESSQRVLLDAGIRALYCIPLIGPNDLFVGMLSIYFREPAFLSRDASIVLDTLAQKAAILISGAHSLKRAGRKSRPVM